MDAILAHVGNLSWDAAVWSDDNLATKKLYPKFQFTCKAKSWLPRLKTSEKSMELCVLRLQRLHEKKPEYQRKKPDSAVVDECSQLAALAANLAQEIQLVVPISKSKIDENFLIPFSEGCALIQKELEVALLEKSDKFEVRSIPTFRRLIEEQAFSRSVSVSKIEEDSLAADRLALVLKQCKYDRQVFETWTRKVSSAKLIREQTEHEWKLGQSKKCEAVAEIYLKSCLHLAVWDVKVPERCISEIMEFKKNTVMAKLGLTNSSDVAVALWMNWSSPSLIHAQVQSSAMQVLAWSLHDQMFGMAAILGPAFAYGRGRLHLEDRRQAF